MLDKRYKSIYLDLTQKKTNDLNMVFSISDNQTSDFYINITKNGFKIDLSNYKTVLYIKNPNGIILDKELTSYDISTNLYYCNLDSDYKNIEGKYECQIMIQDVSTGEKIVLQDTFSYKVNKDMISEKNGTTTTPSKDVKIEYSPNEKKIIVTGKADYDAKTKSIKI